MSAVVAAPLAADAPRTAVVLLGTGVVGRALLTLLATPAARSLRLVGVANSKRQHATPDGLLPGDAAGCLARGRDGRENAPLLAALDATGAPRKVVIDATACAIEAGRHAGWLAAGYHVVTANRRSPAVSCPAGAPCRAPRRTAASMGMPPPWGLACRCCPRCAACATVATAC